jgi:hypothetical protein
MCNAIVIRTGTVEVRLFTRNLMNCLKICLQLECLSEVLEMGRCVVVEGAHVFCVYLTNIPTVVL